MLEGIGGALQKVVERAGLFLVSLGFIAFVLGLSRGVGHQDWLLILDDVGRYGAMGAGIVLMLVGLLHLMKAPAPLLVPSDYGVKIHTPRSGESVDVVEIAGTLKKAPPEGYKLMILRIYPDADRAIHPLREVDYADDGKSWNAKGCDIGGTSGKNRALGVYLVGKSGQALFKYYTRASEVHQSTKRPGEKNLPLIEVRTEDMIMCEEVPLVRK